VDEGAKININTASAQTLSLLTNMSVQLAANIVDWRNTNGVVSENGDGPTVYAQMQPAYMVKNAPFETVEELKLVYPMDTGLLYGEDRNLNGALDPGEADTNRNNVVDSGILEYVTVYSREANTAPDGSTRINVRDLATSSTQLRTLLETNLTSERATEVMNRLGLNTTGGARGGATAGGGQTGGGQTGGTRGGAAVVTPTPTFASPLAFYLASGMTADEFAAIAGYLTVTNGTFIYGRVNVNTAPAPVLACLPGVGIDLARQLVTFRQQSPDRLISVAWIAEALGQGNDSVLQSLAATDCITTQSYQFTADIAALGPHGRGYRRVKFLFDLTGGTPQIVYRQDLTHLGWALGRYVRQTWTVANNSR
jgi:type II secretory pathway component PulK